MAFIAESQSLSWTMKSMAVIVASLILAGCSCWSTMNPTLLMPAQAAFNAAVLFEDYLEDPECDGSEASILKVASDVLNTPNTLLSVSVAYSLTITWTLLDGLTGNRPDPDKRFFEIRQWIPFGYAQPDPDQASRKPPACQQTTVTR
jgi:hypothetical protein